MLRVIHILALVVMAAFGAFQVNDPDGTTWMLIYGSVAVLSGFAATGRYFRLASAAMWWLFIGMTAILVPDVWKFLANDDQIGFAEGMDSTYPYIERTREFGGLLIASVIAGWTYLVARRRDPADQAK